MLQDEAPNWVVARGVRVMRTHRGDIAIRVTELEAQRCERLGLVPGTVETSVWKLSAGVGSSPAWQWRAPTWDQAARFAVQLVDQTAGAILPVRAAMEAAGKNEASAPLDPP